MAVIEGSVVVATDDEIKLATSSVILRAPDKASAVHLFFESTDAIDRTIGALLSLKRAISEAAEHGEKPAEETVPA